MIQDNFSIPNILHLLYTTMKKELLTKDVCVGELGKSRGGERRHLIEALYVHSSGARDAVRVARASIVSRAR